MRVVEGTAEIDDVGTFVETLSAIGDRYGVTVQAFDARYVVDRAHLQLAVELATRAHDRSDAIAEDFGVETLLYAAGRRQINRALTMGVSEGACPVVAVIVDHERTDTHVGKSEQNGIEAAEDDVREELTAMSTLGEYDPDRIRSFFDVTDTELAATAGDLPDAVRERVALLPVEK
ncbi:KEOPS complex subunit Cgi121 [Haloarcula marismortui]|uniref:KEOPS complex Cgi121-like subunit n=1 Tax=Haloarcula marismortui ATCC 33800 TaxID=662476 RepID=M0K3G6_9EURY|nr:KEOPS complex subunit Cgi121 [Haloarcula sinaiiensis]EMA14395.1 KEOPS complex Cgi121-like subunit [Haloarcula sinaiiensis ATCC 33800]QUJ71610.1 KEOPS complex component [Haloarcula sinaiiensis ATCC 33800]